jgi:iron complex transport system permease protein
MDNHNQIQTLLREPLLWLTILAPLTFVFFLSFGAYSISLSDLFDLSSMQMAVLKLRAARLFCAFVVGGSLAVAGAACQAALRNPLAESYILGVSGGASVGAAAAIIFGLAALSELFIPMFSFVGAIIALTIVLGMSKFWTADTPSSIALAGVVIGSMCSSLLMFMISISNSHELNGITWWLLGCLQPSGNMLLFASAFVLLAATMLFTFLGRDVDAITFGDETAYSLGADPQKLSYILLGLASMLAAFSVAVAGIIGFVGLITPHVMRSLFGSQHRRLFPLCMLAGGIFLMACDTFARCILGSRELPVGVITAFIGGPFFLWILSRRRAWE